MNTSLVKEFMLNAKYRHVNHVSKLLESYNRKMRAYEKELDVDVFSGLVESLSKDLDDIEQEIHNYILQWKLESIQKKSQGQRNKITKN